MAAGMADPVLRLEKLRKNFGGLVVTGNVDLDVMPGELHAVIGPNGAGKTTLINQISGLLAPDAGRIVFGGEEVTHVPIHGRARRGLGRSFQITSILPRFSALENVALAVQGRSGGRHRVSRRRDGMMLRVDKLQAGYGPAQVLFDVSFCVGAGEVVTLLGRNGMGKTTTIKTLMGLLPARGGSARFDDEELLAL